MADFAVAGSVPGQADRNPRGLERGHRVEAIKFVESGQGGLTDGIALYQIAQAPAIKDDEDDRCIHCVCFFKIKSLRYFHHSISHVFLTK